MPTQLVQLALIDDAPFINSTAGAGGVPLETDLDIEKFSIFQEGAQEASRQVVSIEPTVLQLEGGSEFIESKTYAIDVAGLFNQAKRTKLAGWSKNRTPLWIVGYGLDGHILYGYGAITSYSGTGTNMSFKFRMQNDAKGGYDTATSTHSAGFSYSENARAYWKWAANPNNSSSAPLWFTGHPVSGVSYGQNSPNNPSPSGVDESDLILESVEPKDFVNGEWRVDGGSTGHNNWWHMYFPFDNVTLNYTVNVASFTPPSSGNHSINLRSSSIYYGYGDFTAEDSVSLTSTGIHTSTITTPVGTTVLRGYQSTRPSGRLFIKEPRLTVDEVKPFTEFNT